MKRLIVAVGLFGMVMLGAGYATSAFKKVDVNKGLDSYYDVCEDCLTGMMRRPLGTKPDGESAAAHFVCPSCRRTEFVDFPSQNTMDS